MKAFVDPRAWARLREACEAAYPHEACGVLLGALGDPCEVREAHPVPNLETDRSHDRYRLDAGAQLGVERGGRERGLDTVGYYHSHPDHPANASATDLERSWEGVLYCIVEVRHGRAADVRGWFRHPGAAAFEPVELGALSEG